jgi:hypothetical protein
MSPARIVGPEHVRWPPASNDPALQGEDGGGSFGDMEERVARLERETSEIKAVLGRMEPLLARLDERFKALDERFKSVANSSDVAELKISLAEIRGRVNAMPTTLQLISFTLAILVAAGLLGYLRA